MARRIALGETTTEALSSASVALGTDAQSLQVLFGMSSLLGGDFTRSIDGLAETIEKRRASQQETLAAVAGMTLSARIIAGLPLLCIPLGPASGARSTTPPD
jgi:Flp pilus assembly protein TadB